MTEAELGEKFRREFGAAPRIFSAPGRVNLIGEHTDYNQGFVLPSAIGFYTRAAVAPRSDRKLFFVSTSFTEEFEFDLDNLPSRKLGSWCDYVLGVAKQLKEAGADLKGASLLVQGEVPLGAGLSSSAALEVAAALALLSAAGTELPTESLPRLCQRAENEFVGAHVGIMDQFVSCFGAKHHAVLLDCRSLEYQLVAIPESVKLVICNTKVKHEHSSGEYNRRRAQCEEAVKFLARTWTDIRSLRDVSVEQLSSVAGEMPPVLYKRARHVVTENQRVLQTTQAFGAGDLQQVGKLMCDSHRSLRDDYEVSCRELDLMVQAGEDLPGYYGGRMTGGGFGGCTVNLVATEHADTFAKEIGGRYHEKAGILPDVFVCSPADGAATKTLQNSHNLG